jgi:hypothetical protein
MVAPGKLALKQDLSGALLRHSPSLRRNHATEVHIAFVSGFGIQMTLRQGHDP